MTLAAVDTFKIDKTGRAVRKANKRQESVNWAAMVEVERRWEIREIIQEIEKYKLPLKGWEIFYSTIRFSNFSRQTF